LINTVAIIVGLLHTCFLCLLLACLHDQNKSGFFGGPAFFPANQRFLKTLQIALIGWIKTGPSKKPLDHVNRLYCMSFLLFCFVISLNKFDLPESLQELI